MQASTPRVKFLVAWALMLALKLAFATSMPLFGDEAFYAWAALHPAWAYSDLPGGTAGLIGLGTALLGDSYLGVRIGSVAVGAALPWLVIRLARRVAEAGGGDPDNAWRAGLWSLPIPLLLPLGVLALPDALLTFAALLALDACAGLLQHDLRHRESAWRAALRGDATLHLQLAVALALGALAHYRFGPLIVVGAIAFLACGGLRHWRSPGLWLALILGALAWLPLVHFNLGVDSAGLRFQLVERHPWQFHAEGLGQPLLQAIITTPLLYALMLWALISSAGSRGSRTGDARASDDGHGALPVLRFLAFAGLGLWLFYALLAPFVDRARFSLHWPLPAYLVAAALLPTALDASRGLARRLAPWAAALAWAATALIAALMAVPASPQLAARSAGTAIHPDNFLGWREIAAAVGPRIGPGDALVADHFMLAAQLSFELDRRPDVFVLDHWNNTKHGRAAQLALWGYDEAGIAGIAPGTRAWIAFEVGETPERDRAEWVARVCRWFEDVRFVEAVDGPGGGKRFWLYRGVRAGVTRREADAGVAEAAGCGASLPLDADAAARVGAPAQR